MRPHRLRERWQPRALLPPGGAWGCLRGAAAISGREGTPGGTNGRARRRARQEEEEEEEEGGRQEHSGPREGMKNEEGDE